MKDILVDILTTIIGAGIGAIVSIWAKRMLEDKKPSQSQIKVWWALIVGIIIGGIGGYVGGQYIVPWLRPAYITIPNPVQPATIAITEPQDQQQVPRVIWTKGTFQGLPAGWKIWVVVHPYGTGVWFPQEATSISGQTEGSWQTLSHIGLEGDVDKGRSFDIAVVIADQKTSDELAKHVGKPGILLDATFYARITVVRE